MKLVNMKVEDIRHIHFVGIKGVGMTAMALYAQDMGKRVTGSDVQEQFVTEEILSRRKIAVSHAMYSDTLPKGTDALIYSAAFPNNPKITNAQHLGLPVLSYAQALGQLTIGKELIATCGVGGKSTTAAMIATILEECNYNPAFLVGVGSIHNLGAPGRWSTGKHVIVEADEYVAVPGIDRTPKFLYLSPSVIVVTNIEFDHPDVYRDPGTTQEVFRKFFQRLPENGLLVANIDSQSLQEVLRKLKSDGTGHSIVTYGFSPQADWRVDKVVIRKGKTHFRVSYQRVTQEGELSVPGKFNAANATAALIVANHLGIGNEQAIRALSKFQGTQRRFQKIGVVSGIEVWDDYAHHPKQIQVTLHAAREWFSKKRLVIVFQPHTYSRTKALLVEFAKSLSLADEIVITDIYASAREQPDPNISSEILTAVTKQYNNNTRFLPEGAVLRYLRKSLKKGDVLMTLGAGDVYRIGEHLLSVL